MGERLLCKQEAVGSIPSSSTTQESKDSSQKTERAVRWSGCLVTSVL